MNSPRLEVSSAGRSATPPWPGRAPGPGLLDLEKITPKAGSSLPSGLSSAERASWHLRGLAECALFAVATHQDTEALDAGVAALGPQGAIADPTFADRLRALRSRLGPPPAPYLRLGKDWAAPVRSPSPDPSATARFCAIADLVGPGAAGPDMQPVSAANGYGIDALRRREAWRAGAGPFADVAVVPIGVPAELAWRVWASSTAGKPLVVVVAEELDPRAMDVWWGVHNGTHLDHIWHMAGSGRDPLDIQFGRGLLSAESLAMSAELLAGFESSDPTVRATIWDGLVERVARLGVPEEDPSACAAAARRQSDHEFTALPTLSMAYTVGVVELLRCRFHDPYIPSPLAEATAARWDAVLDHTPELARILWSTP